MTDFCNPRGIPRPELNAIAKLSHEVLLLCGPSSPRLVVCADGAAAEAMATDELERVHNDASSRWYSDELVPRLLATVEALRVTP